MIDYPKTVFSPQLIERVGDIGKVLGEFMDEQKALIQEELVLKYPKLSQDAVQKLLNEFITLEGTKRPLRRSQISSSVMKDEQLDYCLELLEKSRILRFEDGLYELAHDTLALKISEDRSASEIAFLEVIKLVKDRRSMHSSTKTLLNQNELQLLKSVEARMINEGVLNDEEWKYIGISRKYVSRQKIILWSALSAIFIFLTVAALFSFQQRGIALTNLVIAEEAQLDAETNLKKLAEEQEKRTVALYNEHLASGKALITKSQYILAIQELNVALAFNENGEEAIKLKIQCEQLSGLKGKFELLINQGDALFARGDNYLVDARNKYLSARRLGYKNVLAEIKISAVEGKMPIAFEKFMRNGDTFRRVDDCQRALENYRQALRIRPNDAELKLKIDSCE